MSDQLTRLHKTTLYATVVLAIGGVVLIGLPSTFHAARLIRSPIRSSPAVPQPDGSPSEWAAPSSPAPQDDPSPVASWTVTARTIPPRRPNPANRRGVVRGTLLWRDGTPAADVPVWGEARDPVRVAGQVAVERVRSGADGTFALRLREGSWVVVAEVLGARVASQPLVVLPRVEMLASLPPLERPAGAWPVVLRDPGRRILRPRAARAFLRLGGSTLRASVRRDDDRWSLAIPAPTKPPRYGQLTLHPGPRFRTWRGRVALPPPGEPLTLTLTPVTPLEVELLLSAAQERASLSVFAIEGGAPLVQRSGLGLAGLSPDALWSGAGVVEAIPGGGRRVRVMVGLERDPPLTLRLVARAVRPWGHGEDPRQAQREVESFVDLPRREPARIDLRP